MKYKKKNTLSYKMKYLTRVVVKYLGYKKQENNEIYSLYIYILYIFYIYSITNNYNYLNPKY